MTQITKSQKKNYHHLSFHYPSIPVLDDFIDQSTQSHLHTEPHDRGKGLISDSKQVTLPTIHEKETKSGNFDTWVIIPHNKMPTEKKTLQLKPLTTLDPTLSNSLQQSEILKNITQVQNYQLLTELTDLFDSICNSGNPDFYVFFDIISQVIGMGKDFKQLPEIMERLLQKGNLRITVKELENFTNKKLTPLKRQVEIIFILHWVHHLETKRIITKLFLKKEHPTIEQQNSRIRKIYSSRFPSRFYTPCLTVTHPHVAELFNLEKNAPITPQDLTKGMSKNEYWWTCPKCNKDYKATVKSRTNAKYPDCYICSQKRGIFGAEWYNWQILGGVISKEEYPNCKLGYENWYYGIWEDEFRVKIPDCTFTDANGSRVARDYKLDGSGKTIETETIPKYAPDFDRIEIACYVNPRPDYSYECIDSETGEMKRVTITYLTSQQLLTKVKDVKKRKEFEQRLKKLREEITLPFDGFEGLNQALAFVQKLYDTTGKIPNPATTFDETLILIRKAVTRGAWADKQVFGERTVRKNKWSDFTKQIKGYKQPFQETIFTPDPQGLEKAIAYVQILYDTTGKIPGVTRTANSTLKRIWNAINRKAWADEQVFGERTVRKGKWSDFTKHIKGYKRPPLTGVKFTTQETVFVSTPEGQDRALTYTQKFYDTTGKIPNPTTTDDLTLKRIFKAVKRGAWADKQVFGTRTVRRKRWSDFTKLIKGYTSPQSKYTTQETVFVSTPEGLDQALAYAQKLYDITGKFTKSLIKNDSTVRRIFNAIYRGTWADKQVFGTRTVRKSAWSDFTKLIKGYKPSPPTFKYTTQETVFVSTSEGLDQALTYTQKLYDTTGKIPYPKNSDDSTLKRILNAINRGDWMDKEIFGDRTVRKGKWTDFTKLIKECKRSAVRKN
ncbi:MAG: zinc-ribbon domain-containing protein [Promethearchaeota archaeon]